MSMRTGWCGGCLLAFILLADVLSGRVSVESLVTRRIPLEQAPDALAALTTTFEHGVTIIEP